MTSKMDLDIATYRTTHPGKIAAGKEWLARGWHPRVGLYIPFEAATEQAAIDGVSAIWEKDRAVREATWARKDKAKRAGKPEAVDS